MGTWNDFNNNKTQIKKQITLISDSLLSPILGGEEWECVAQLDALVSFFVSCGSPTDCAGGNRQDCSFGNAMGLRQNQFTVLQGSQRWAVDRRALRRTQWTPNNRITIHSHAIASKWPSRSSHHTSHIKSRIMYNSQQNSHSRLASTRPYRPGSALIKYCKVPMDKNGSISAGSTQNWVIRVALALLRVLLSLENWVYSIFIVLNYNYITEWERLMTNKVIEQDVRKLADHWVRALWHLYGQLYSSRGVSTSEKVEIVWRELMHSAEGPTTKAIAVKLSKAVWWIIIGAARHLQKTELAVILCAHELPYRETSSHLLGKESSDSEKTLQRWNSALQKGQ